MQTYTGRRFFPLDPHIDDICIEDIAHALALQCRYGGHCLQFYSVAEHSVLLARYVLAQTPVDPRLALWLLLHDASEAYLTDMIRPLKPFMPQYRSAEDRVQWAAYQRFGLDPAVEPREVKQLDKRIVLDERARVMRPTDEVWDYGSEATQPLGVTLQLWSWRQAELEFLVLFRELFKEDPCPI